MNNKIKILIGEGSDYFWNKSVLENSHYLEVIDSVNSGAELINRCQQIKPDIVFIDMILQDMTGLEAARWIREQNKDIKLLLFSLELRKEFLDACMEIGVNGYLWKCSDMATIERAIQMALNNTFFVQKEAAWV